jgi:hypothetical protein
MRGRRGSRRVDGVKLTSPPLSIFCIALHWRYGIGIMAWYYGIGIMALVLWHWCYGIGIMALALGI